MIVTDRTLTSGVTSTEVLVIGGKVVVHVGIAMVTKDVCLSQALHAEGKNIKCLRGFDSTHVISENSFSTSVAVWDVYCMWVLEKCLATCAVAKLISLWKLEEVMFQSPHTGPAIVAHLPQSVFRPVTNQNPLTISLLYPPAGLLPFPSSHTSTTTTRRRLHHLWVSLLSDKQNMNLNPARMEIARVCA